MTASDGPHLVIMAQNVTHTTCLMLQPHAFLRSRTDRSGIMCYGSVLNALTLNRSDTGGKLVQCARGAPQSHQYVGCSGVGSITCKNLRRSTFEIRVQHRSGLRAAQNQSSVQVRSTALRLVQRGTPQLLDSSQQLPTMQESLGKLKDKLKKVNLAATSATGTVAADGTSAADNVAAKAGSAESDPTGAEAEMAAASTAGGGPIADQTQEDSEQSTRPDDGKRRKAVLVACNYPGQCSELHGCVADAINVGNLLKWYGYDIVVLHDIGGVGGMAKATKFNIRAAIDWLVHDNTKDDLLFFYYSGARSD